MIEVAFPDGSRREFASGITGIEIAKNIATSLAKDALAIEIDGELKDLSIPLEKNATIKIITSKSPEALEIIRHDTAHILAQAVKELYPDAQITIGPSIENGFYYDIARKIPFSSDDLAVIEKRMAEIVKRGEAIKREIWKRDDAVEFFKKIGEYYKAEIIASIPSTEDISLYRHGDFIDLCRGPHALSTAYPKYFKLMKLAGAYWRGDSNNEMLQRIYGTAWATKEQLDNYLFMLEEAEKRDHRKLGRELNLFHLQEEARGMPFWHPKGWTIYRLIEQYIRNKISKNGYVEIKTPMLVDLSLWKASGHWDKFKENMFISEVADEQLALKPMNCPCHIQVFNQGIKSYRNLPLRMAEFGSCHRYEPSGALHGLMRVRSFVQDDAHIFCEESQVTSETIAFCQLLLEVYKDFGFTDVKVKFSDRPEVRVGDDSIWDKAENSLKEAVKSAGLEYSLNKGEGAFYGPKLEFVLRDAIGRDWQCGTFQVDFFMPQRLGAEYVTSTGERAVPVMLHRAIVGSFERFIGILIEEYAGKFPLWLAPIQAMVLTVTNEMDDYAKAVHQQLLDAGVRADIDISSEKISYKIREFSLQKIPLLVIIGKQEQADNNLTIRVFGSNEQQIMSCGELIAMVAKENSRYL